MLNEISQEKTVHNTDYIYMLQKMQTNLYGRKQITACLETGEKGGKKGDYKRV